MKLAILDDYSGAALESADWSLLPEVEVTVFRENMSSEDDLAEALADFEIVCLMRERTLMPGGLIARLPKLRMIASTGYHNPSIDREAVRGRGILVTGTPRISRATPEFVMTLMLALARNVVPQADLIRAGGWEYGLGRQLSGATLGILGLGNVGAKVAELGRAFGMEVIAWSQNLTPEKAAEKGVGYAPKDDFFRRTDFLSVHLKLSDRTRHIVGAPELALMKPDAFLINTARALNVDMDALVAALEAGRLAGAAIDIFETEPLPPDHPFRTTPGLLVTPHMGYVTRETMRLFYSDVVAAVRAFLDGEEPKLRLS